MRNAARGSANARDRHSHILSNGVQGTGGHPHFPTHLIRPFHLRPAWRGAKCGNPPVAVQQASAGSDGSTRRCATHPHSRAPACPRSAASRAGALAFRLPARLRNRTKRRGPGAVRGAAQQDAAAARCWLARAPASALCAAYPLLSQPNSHFPSLSSYPPCWGGFRELEKPQASIEKWH